MSRLVFCQKLQRELPGLKYQPFPNELGKKIYENISQEAWDEWIKYQTIIINENRLNLADPDSRKYIMQQLELFLFGN